MSEYVLRIESKGGTIIPLVKCETLEGGLKAFGRRLDLTRSLGAPGDRLVLRNGGLLIAEFVNPKEAAL